jgi:hypothetical protein
MKTVSLLLAAIVLIIAGCKKDDDDDQTTPKKQLLAKVRIVEDASLFLDADYNGEKLVEIRELPRDVVTRYHDFTFNSKGKVAAFTRTSPGLQGKPNVLKHQFTYFGDFLQEIIVTQDVAGSPVFVESYDFTKNGSKVRVVRRNKNQQPVAQRTANYDSLGNMTLLIQQSLPGGEPDTVEFTNYDKHPNTFETITWFLDVYDFLPPSANNVGTVTSRRGTLPPAINQLTYEYNKQGNPVKIIQKGQTMLLQYKDL